MDFMKVKKKFKTKCVSGVLDSALQAYAEQGGLVAQKPKGRNSPAYRHIDSICCAQQSSDLSSEFYLCWHLAYLVQNQHEILTVDDLLKIGYNIEQAAFDSKKELAGIQESLARIINQEVVLDTGLFYSEESTPEDDSSHPRVGLCLSSQSQVCFFECTVHVPF